MNQRNEFWSLQSYTTLRVKNPQEVIRWLRTGWKGELKTKPRIRANEESGPTRERNKKQEVWRDTGKPRRSNVLKTPLLCSGAPLFCIHCYDTHISFTDMMELRSMHLRLYSETEPVCTCNWSVSLAFRKALHLVSCSLFSAYTA